MFDASKIEDSDPDETREWLESMDSVLRVHGAERAHYLLERVIDYTRRSGAYLPFKPNTAYVNTIATVQEQDYPGDRALERASRPTSAGTRWRWWCRPTGRARSTAATSPATLRRPPCTRSASTTSGARPSDRPSRATWCSSRATRRPASTRGPSSRGGSPRTSCGISARRSAEAGLSSYPHPWLMPDFWQFPTVSMGLGPMMAIYQARFSALPGASRHHPGQRPQGVGVPRRRRNGRAGVARRDHACRCARSSTTWCSSSTATCSGSTARCAATARSSRSWRPRSSAPAGTSSR